MIPFYILLALLFGFRAAGLLGAGRFSNLQDAAVPALAIMFVFAGVTHFTGLKHDYLAMIPPPFPREVWVVYVTGALELLGAVGLAVPFTRKAAGICLALLLFAMFPANIYAAFHDIPFGGRPAASLWLRVPVQVVLVTLLLWISALPDDKRPVASTF